MRYGIILLAGLIGGFLIANLWQQPDPTASVAANPESSVAESPENSASLFAPVTETKSVTAKKAVVAENLEVTKGGSTHNAIAPIESVDLADIDHYVRLTSFFAQLETTDTDQLQQLAQKVRSQFQHNFSSQYYNAISTAAVSYTHLTLPTKA